MSLTVNHLLLHSFHLRIYLQVIRNCHEMCTYKRIVKGSKECFHELSTSICHQASQSSVRSVQVIQELNITSSGVIVYVVNAIVCCEQIFIITNIRWPSVNFFDCGLRMSKGRMHNGHLVGNDSRAHGHLVSRFLGAQAAIFESSIIRL